MQIGCFERRCGGNHPCVAGVLTQEDFIPIHTQIRNDAHFAAGRKEVDRYRDGFRFSCRHAHIRIHRFPITARILHLQIGHHEAGRRFLRCSSEGAAIRPIDPSVEQQDGFAGGRRVPEIQVECVQVRYAGLRTLEVVWIMLVFREKQRQNIRAVSRRARPADRCGSLR